MTRSDVLHVEEGHPFVTIVDDLTDARSIPSDALDCVICPQTLDLIYDVRAAIRTSHRILKPGGTALVTVPGTSQNYDAEWQDARCWSFTPGSVRRLFGECFAPACVDVEGHGNVLVAISFLMGFADKELSADELDHRDPGYDIVVTVRVVKEPGPPAGSGG